MFPHPLHSRRRTVFRPDDPRLGYPFYWRDGHRILRRQGEAQAADFARSHLYPSRTDKDYLVYEARREILGHWIDDLPASGLRVLDVGGRIQPYRPLLERRAQLYVSVDPILEGQLDVLAVGEQLPFASSSYDLVLCTQVLGYAARPDLLIAEIHRVLVADGQLFLTAPAIFPRYHDHRWQFMPAGLDHLLEGFHRVEIVPEGGSVAGFMRTLNLFLDTFVRPGRARSWIRYVYRVVNMVGAKADPLFPDRNEFATNYACRATK